MAGKNTAVYGIYRDRPVAEEAVDRILAAGFRNEDVSALLQDNVGTKDFAHEKATKAPEGTATGAATGAAIGGSLGLLARFLGLDPSSPPDQSWRLWPVSDQGEWLAASLERSSEWVSLSLRRSVMRPCKRRRHPGFHSLRQQRVGEPRKTNLERNGRGRYIIRGRSVSRLC
jgi:hypothetical protein